MHLLILQEPYQYLARCYLKSYSNIETDINFKQLLLTGGEDMDESNEEYKPRYYSEEELKNLKIEAIEVIEGYIGMLIELRNAIEYGEIGSTNYMPEILEMLMGDNPITKAVGIVREEREVDAMIEKALELWKESILHPPITYREFIGDQEDLHKLIG